MRRHFQIKNLTVFLGTFGLGIAAASLFSPSPVTRTREEIISAIRSRSETCVAGDHSGSERRMLLHTERERLLMDRIHETQKKLIEVMGRNYLYSPKAEKEAAELQRRLEARIQILKDQLKKELHRANRSRILDEPGSTKLVYREHCY